MSSQGYEAKAVTQINGAYALCVLARKVWTTESEWENLVRRCKLRFMTVTFLHSQHLKDIGLFDVVIINEQQYVNLERERFECRVVVSSSLCEKDVGCAAPVGEQRAAL